MGPTWKIVAYSSVPHWWQPTCGPIMIITYWPNMGNTDGKHTWVSCGSFEKQNTWVPRGKLLHTPVCPISGSPRVAHERHTRGSFMGPVEFCYLGLFRG